MVIFHRQFFFLPLLFNFSSKTLSVLPVNSVMLIKNFLKWSRSYLIHETPFDFKQFFLFSQVNRDEILLESFFILNIQWLSDLNLFVSFISFAYYLVSLLFFLFNFLKQISLTLDLLFLFFLCPFFLKYDLFFFHFVYLFHFNVMNQLLSFFAFKLVLLKSFKHLLMCSWCAFLSLYILLSRIFDRGGFTPRLNFFNRSYSVRTHNTLTSIFVKAHIFSAMTKLIVALTDIRDRFYLHAVRH